MRHSNRHEKEIVKLHWTTKEVAAILGVTEGLIFYQSGILKLGTRPGDGKNPRRFTSKELAILKNELE